VSIENDQTRQNDQKEYLCIGLFADNCNRILSLARGKRKAEELGLELCMVDSTMNDWYYSWFDPSPHVKLTEPGEMVNCVRNMTGKQAYYHDFKNQRAGNPFLPQLAKYFLPRKDLRERVEKAMATTYGETPILSVHRRNHRSCWWRATEGTYGRNVGGGTNCSKSTMVTMCGLSYADVQSRFNPRNLPVVLFTDGRNETLDSTFPVIDSHNFTDQIWMMTLTAEHVGIPVSTVDLVVNHWRYAQGRGKIYPTECYNEFKEEYVMDQGFKLRVPSEGVGGGSIEENPTPENDKNESELQLPSEGVGGVSIENDQTRQNDQKEYLCIGLFADNCNRILSLARGKRKAEELGLELCMVDSTMNDWYYSWFDPSPHVKLTEPGEMVNCVRNMTGKQAYYHDFKNQRAGNPFLPQLAKYFLPRKDLRERVEKAMATTYGETPILSVHRRNHRSCWWRATEGTYGRNVGGGTNCSKSTMVTMCGLSYADVQSRFNPRNLPVVLFTDGRNETLDSTFPVIDSHNFTDQIWMMTLTAEHVGIPVSTVDLVVNHWRYAQGRGKIYPTECYNEFKEEYVMDPSHF